MRRICFLLVAVATAILTFSAHASDRQFFNGIKGKWSGPGEIVAGKFKGTKFVCTFGGETQKASTGMAVDGSCRVGMFSQPMNAKIATTAGKYIGQFLDGAKGEGMDIVGGRYTSQRLVVDIKRKDLNGVMVANLTDPNRLNVTISVKHNGRLIPVIGMSLKRQAGATITGSIN